MSKEVSPRMVKLGEFDAFDTVQLVKILIEQFPDYEFVIEKGKTYDWFSLYSSCDKEMVRDAVDEYLRNKPKDDYMEKSSHLTVH
ncbi:MAG: hypothetical protein ACXAEX_15310 [Promethearchaeota archaeon]